MPRKIFVPQLSAKEVWPILDRYGYKLPSNCIARSYIARWYYGVYYGSGRKDLWIPLGRMGGMATRAFDSCTVKFPKRVNAKLVALLEVKRKAALNS